MSGVEKAIDAGVELAKLGYTDGLQPAVKTTGKALDTTVKAASIALEPLAMMVWSYGTLKGALLEWLAPHLTVIPQENIRTPSPVVAVPVIQALSYSASEAHLREMYVKLLASAMNTDTAKTAHPGFVDVIRQLTADEAAILPLLARATYHPLVTLRHQPKGKVGSRANKPNCSNLALLAGCKHPDLVSEYIDNLQRLGVVEVKNDGRIADPVHYEPVEEMPNIAEVLSDYAHYGFNPHLNRHYMEVTSFGRLLCSAVLGDGAVSDNHDINVEIPVLLALE